MRTKFSIAASVAVLATVLSVGLLGCEGSEAQAFWTGAAEGYVAGSDGQRFIGSASTQSECYRLAENAGCSTRYMYSSNTGNCFCK